MTKTFTPDDLLRYVYNEATEKEKEEIEGAILVNSDLAESVKELRCVLQDLSSVHFDASSNSIKNVLKYSKTLSLHASHD